MSLSLETVSYAASDCLGAKGASARLIYLHGLGFPEKIDKEQGENIQILQQLAQKYSLRIALPRGTLCEGGKLCWPAGDTAQLQASYRRIKAEASACWPDRQAQGLLGFSNGGYFAWKLYKQQEEPSLKLIIAAGSVGTWDDNRDRPNTLSTFHLIMGKRDLLFKDAESFAAKLRKVIPGFSFEPFAGGHRLDYDALSKLFQRQAFGVH